MTYQDYEEARDVAMKQIGGAEIAVVLGSGLGDYAEEFEDVRELSTATFPASRPAPRRGTPGKLISGTKAGKRVLIMSGRMHMYEGIPLEQIAFPIRVLKLMGVKNLILTNAAGGVNAEFQAR